MIHSNATASDGEICCSGQKNPDGTCDYLDTTGICSHGLSDYKTNFIQPISKSIHKYCDRVPMAIIIEPDSLANLVTNSGDAKCSNDATKASYKKGVSYAVNAISKACPRATIYVDGAHGVWLGWDSNRKKFAGLIKELRITELIRGFSLNVANYQPLGKRCPSLGFCLPTNAKSKDECCEDPCGLSACYNPGHNELNYALELQASVSSTIKGFIPHMIIGTSRSAPSVRAGAT